MSSKRTIMIALGGNALAPKGEAGTIAQQFARTRESLDGIMHFVNLDYNLSLITHIRAHETYRKLDWPLGG